MDRHRVQRYEKRCVAYEPVSERPLPEGDGRHDTEDRCRLGPPPDEWSEERQLYPGLVPVEGSGMDEPCSGQRQEDRCERGVGRDHVSVRYPAKVLEQGTARLTCTRQSGGRQVDWAVEGASEWSLKWTVTAGESTATAWPDREGQGDLRPLDESL